MSTRESITLIGAGLAGSLLAGLLAQRGFDVTVYERRRDPRKHGYEGGRSINLALAERGFHGLRQAGLEKSVLEHAVAMRGRMVHDVKGQTNFQAYGMNDDEVIWSISRGRLNMILLDMAEQAGAKIVFEHRLVDVDFTRGYGMFCDESTGSLRNLKVGVLIGSDGAGSALRAAMIKQQDLGERFEPLGHSYKELEIPPQSGGGFRMEQSALHIWPRGGYMLIALPNTEGSYTVTLFLPNEGNPSFATLNSVEAAREFFDAQFPDARALIPELEKDFFDNPTGWLATLRLEHWHLDGKALLLGDAAHAVVPFHGQGMNCAFEDCVALAELIDRHRSGSKAIDWNTLFADFERDRKPNANAIADMAIENYIEMRDLVDDANFLHRKSFERRLSELFPGRYISRYALVMFHRVPYAEAKRRGLSNAKVIDQLTAKFDTAADLDLDAAKIVLDQAVN